MGSPGMGELPVILVIIVLLFGVNKISQLGKGLGEGIRNFKSAMKEPEEPDHKS
jgi:sec-independent protein translocase protein TatA